MDWNFTEDQQDIRKGLKQLFKGMSTDDALKALDKKGEYFHEALWKQLCETGMVGLALPEAVGGAGMGILELCLLLHQAGRTVAQIPALSTLVSAALPIAEFGNDEQKQRLLGGVAKGELILGAALSDVGSMDPYVPAATAKAEGEGYTLEGRFTNVSWADRAERILVAAKTEAGVGVFLLDPKAAGVKLEGQKTSHGEPTHLMTLSGAKVEAADVLGSPDKGSEILKFTVDRTILGMCAIELGIAEEAMFMTAKYAAERKQFGTPIGTFQAVTQRVGDCYVDTQTMKVTLWQAAWKLSEGIDADRDLAIAKFMAADGGARVTFAAQHVHGGMGFDRDYPLYRYFLLSKTMEFSLGGAEASLARLGESLATSSL